MTEKEYRFIARRLWWFTVFWPAAVVAVNSLEVEVNSSEVPVSGSEFR